jgi:hypothetical protein
MLYKVQQQYTEESPLLALPNVRVLIHVRDWPKGLLPNGNEGEFPVIQEEGALPEAQRKAFATERRSSVSKGLRSRHWRSLRQRLISLDLADTPDVCKWLANAGYIPFGALSAFEQSKQLGTVSRWPPILCREEIAKIANEAFGWAPEYVTPEIVAVLKKYRDVLAWLMRMETRRFRRAIGKAFQYTRDEWIRNQAIMRAVGTMVTCKIKDPAAIFLEETKAPNEIDVHTLRLCLQGTGTAMILPAQFWWYPDGTAFVTIETDSPLNAIGLSVHIDRNFSMRRWVFCAKCGEGFEQNRGRVRFCSDKCRNYLITTERRLKIRWLKSGAQAWDKLFKERRKRHKRCEWIAAWAARKSKLQIEPLWAKQELAKIKVKTQEQKSVREDRKEEKWHS